MFNYFCFIKLIFVKILGFSNLKSAINSIIVQVFYTFWYLWVPNMVDIILEPLSQLKVTICANKIENYFFRSFPPKSQIFPKQAMQKFQFWGKIMSWLCFSNYAHYLYLLYSKKLNRQLSLKFRVLKILDNFMDILKFVILPKRKVCGCVYLSVCASVLSIFDFLTWFE